MSPASMTCRANSTCAERLSGDGNNILYQFAVSHAGRCLLEGRAAVVLDAGR
jgi:hypothetical protein